MNDVIILPGEHFSCPCCGYDWAGSRGPACPECGLRREDELLDQYLKGRQPASFECPRASFVLSSLSLVRGKAFVLGLPSQAADRFAKKWFAIGIMIFTILQCLDKAIAFSLARPSSPSVTITRQDAIQSIRWLPIYVFAFVSASVLVKIVVERRFRSWGLAPADARRALACCLPLMTIAVVFWPLLGLAIDCPSRWPLAISLVGAVLVYRLCLAVLGKIVRGWILRPTAAMCAQCGGWIALFVASDELFKVVWFLAFSFVTRPEFPVPGR
jgi:hypothetical protein